MKKTAMTDVILKAKADKQLRWEQIAEHAGLAPEFTTSACLGMNSMPKENADKLCAALALPAEVSAALQEFPHKSWDKWVPTDPVIYRLYEIVAVYGETIKQIIHEKFGDGIMSAIDFSMHIEKVPDPKGDRVKLTMNGKFLPYKTW
ncbi:MAG: cyanase [Gammaproteobacteria bacterium]|nr:cyanase [Gammaproteobacteria bacterium]